MLFLFSGTINLALERGVASVFYIRAILRASSPLLCCLPSLIKKGLPLAAVDKGLTKSTRLAQRGMKEKVMTQAHVDFWHAAMKKDASGQISTATRTKIAQWVGSYYDGNDCRHEPRMFTVQAVEPKNAGWDIAYNLGDVCAGKGQHTARWAQGDNIVLGTFWSEANDQDEGDLVWYVHLCVGVMPTSLAKEKAEAQGRLDAFMEGLN
jgi:hypothetical protein